MFHGDRPEKILYIGVLITILVGLYFSSFYSYLLFHSLIELVTIAIAFGLFILTWHTHQYGLNSALKLLGISYAFIALLDLLHMLAYKGMPIFPGYGTNLPTQLWIAARYLQAATLCAAPFVAARKVDHRVLLVGYAAAFFALVVGIFSGHFPDCYVEGQGLTQFKIDSEYLITALLIVAAYFFYRKRPYFNNRVFFLLAASIACTILSELSFTNYLSVYDFANLVGHFAKLAAFYLIYQAILVTGLKTPFELIFRDLKQAEARTARLQGVIEQFSKALTPAQVAQVLIDQGLAVMGAIAGLVVLRTKDDTILEVVAARGYDKSVTETGHRFSVDTPTLLADAVRRDEGLWFESMETYRAQYPTGDRTPTGYPGALAALPLMIDAHTFGAIGLTFAQRRSFAEEEKRLMLALAHQCAQALDRARLYEAEHQAHLDAAAARQRFRLLADTSALLATSLDYETTLNNLEFILLPTFADYYMVDLLQEEKGEDVLRRVAVNATEPAVRDALEQTARRYSPDPKGAFIRKALQLGEAYWVPEIPPGMLEQAARDAEHAALYRQIGSTSSINIPLMVRGQALGVLSVGMSRSGRRYSADDVSLGEELARRIAQAIDNARLYEKTQMNAEALQQQVDAQTQELQGALERARAADRAKSMMLANVSHEMRTPLSSITGFSHLLLSRRTDGDKQRQYLTAIHDEGRRLTTLVDDILNLQQIEAGRQVFRFTCIDIGALLEETLVKECSLEKTERIQLSLEPTDPVQADADRIRQVLLNLVANALKFSEGDIEVLLHQEEAAVHVSVRDQGIGIPPEALEHLFQIFQRGENAERERIRGTGLGLALCKQIIEAHDGHIWAESAGEGQGATFHFTLPLAVADA